MPASPFPGPPAGTVTFLFTDIEGSTKRWEQQSQEMSAALSRHDDILRHAIEANGGYIFKTMGDAFCAAFPTAPQALQASLDAQRALHGEDWATLFRTPNATLRVRMALHVGAAEERDGDYYGQPVNRVARLLSAGHGGQVLLSAPAYDLVRDHLPSGVSLLDLGEHRLKDLIRPEHVFQLAAAGLPDDFPPLKTLDNNPNNLPLQPTPLIGREKEVAEVLGQLLREDVRLLNLTGPGGIGKTRLALQASAELSDSFEHGVFFVNLAPITDHSLVVSAIAQVLGVKEAGGRPIVETLKEHLRDRQMLLLLDNFEQVVDARSQVSELLMSAPRLKTLVTSRIALQVRGEKEWPVPPLSLPDIKNLPSLERLTQYETVRLFIERATDIKPDFQVTNDNAPAVAEICARLDGLPLAIELAAVRIRLLPPQSILARLQSRLKLLSGGLKDLPARQQTLRAAIEWSYDLLSPEEQKLFGRLGVFQGGRTLEAIEAVCKADGDLGIDVLDGMGSLISKSLLRQEEGVGGEPRFVMLETIHEFAREKLEESGEGEATRRRHLTFFVELAERVNPRVKTEVSSEVIEQELDNFRAAFESSRLESEAELGLRLSAALWPFFETRGHLTEGRKLLSEVLARHETTQQPKLRSDAFRGAGTLAGRQGDYRAGIKLLEEALQIKRNLGDAIGSMDVLEDLANVTYASGDYEAAYSMFEEGLAYARVHDRAMTSGILNDWGDVIRFAGDYEKARLMLEECLIIRREIGNQWGTAITLNNLGHVLCNLGEYRQAAPLFREAAILSMELGDKEIPPLSIIGLGGVAAGLGQPERAARLLGVADATYRAGDYALWPSDLKDYERYLAIARAQLDETSWQAAWQEGQTMSLEQAVEYALEESTPDQ